MKKRIFRILLILVVLSGGAILCVLRWDAWFFNPPEEEYTVPREPNNIVLTFGEDAVRSRIISWRSDTLASCRLYLTRPFDLQVGQPLVDTFEVKGEEVVSRAGKAVFYSLFLDSLTPGEYRYMIQVDSMCSPAHRFTVLDYEAGQKVRFTLFGDLQYTDSAEASAFLRTAEQTCPEADFQAYVGDIIERPTDAYWQLFFSSNPLTDSLPQVAALGNHEYLKGPVKHYDARWPHVFVNPGNGPERFCGRSYYLNFPWMRLIVLDTDGLQRPSDYCVLESWLWQIIRYEESCFRSTERPNRRWNVVVMHHPMYSSGMARDNWLVRGSLWHVMRKADLVVAGHDHNYARHRSRHRLEQLIGDDEPEFTTPVYVDLSSSAKSYLPKCETDEERLGANRAFFADVEVSDDSLRFTAYMVDSVPMVYDQLLFVRGGKCASVQETDSLPAEILELPARYEGRNDAKVRRFYNRRQARKDAQQ